MPVVGIYGISGCGKSRLLNQLKELTGQIEPDSQSFTFYDGSATIHEVTPGGLDAFKKLSPDEQGELRGVAIDSIAKQCTVEQKVGVVAGHLILWDNETASEGQSIGTTADWQVYTHIVYLHVDAEEIFKRRYKDKTKKRPHTTVDHLRKWQDEEICQLRKICREHEILFTVVSENSGGPLVQSRVNEMLCDFSTHNEVRNRAIAESLLETSITSIQNMETFLLLDADRTLAPQDTGTLFWNAVYETESDANDNPLKTLFKHNGYSYFSFRQATLLYEEEADEFDALCEKVAQKVQLYPEMADLLHQAYTESHAGVAIATCGLRRVWEIVLEREGISQIAVIGGGRLSDGFVVTGSLKGHLVDVLHARRLRVIAFGDSPLDIEMLQKSDYAFVVVGKKESRSRIMDKELEEAIGNGLIASQIVIAAGEEPRLDTKKLPLFQLENAEISWILHRREHFFHATDSNAAKLLMTPTRDAHLIGHDLRAAHGKVGYFLALRFVTDLLGVERHPISHVQGHLTDGYRLRAEQQTLIIPLMRGGESMAFGVSEAFKTASFAHAKKPEDLTTAQLAHSHTIILVDSVVNSGKSIVGFVDYLREVRPSVEIVVVTGVVQEDAVKMKRLGQMLRDDRKLSLVALRLSKNRYTGKGETDTGHRLFNTTYLD
ncbi:hypothetical protein K458DRAFT_390388 [Lentithecium fluviatile CBS 122367]|uniref:Phosphoribosyltransferase domain-containing protein n=1 Tax=Lentithecium fluviatile CBS 122367 TaxID=1168545 RepID=A0A6G1IZ03_9PLEO|nr:hypothetical protein K458DRAFT_390388 [Lentithecium fluviatile CBS 122367]